MSVPLCIAALLATLVGSQAAQEKQSQAVPGRWIFVTGDSPKLGWSGKQGAHFDPIYMSCDKRRGRTWVSLVVPNGKDGQSLSFRVVRGDNAIEVAQRSEEGPNGVEISSQFPTTQIVDLLDGPEDVLIGFKPAVRLGRAAGYQALAQFRSACQVAPNPSTAQGRRFVPLHENTMVNSTYALECIGKTGSAEFCNCTVEAVSKVVQKPRYRSIVFANLNGNGQQAMSLRNRLNSRESDQYLDSQVAADQAIIACSKFRR